MSWISELGKLKTEIRDEEVVLSITDNDGGCLLENKLALISAYRQNLVNQLELAKLGKNEELTINDFPIRKVSYKEVSASLKTLTGEPVCSMLGDTFVGNVDYIFFKNAEVVNTLQHFPSKTQEQLIFPHELNPSDHFLLAAQFRLD